MGMMKMKNKAPLVLYFTEGTKLTDEERKAAYAIGTNIGFRNATLADTERLEDCAAVAGNAPAAYRHAYPMVVSPKQLKAVIDGRFKPMPVPDDSDEDEADEEPLEPVTTNKRSGRGRPPGSAKAPAPVGGEPNAPIPPTNAPTWGNNA